MTVFEIVLAVACPWLFGMVIALMAVQTSITSEDSVVLAVAKKTGYERLRRLIIVSAIVVWPVWFLGFAVAGIVVTFAALPGLIRDLRSNIRHAAK